MGMILFGNDKYPSPQYKNAEFVINVDAELRLVKRK